MSAMDQVRADMRVVDSTGTEVGTVEDFKEGDPGAVTDDGQGAGGESLLDSVAVALGGGADLHPQAAARLLRTGFVRIDRTGMLSGHAYAGADQIARVEDDTVHLSVPADQLLGQD